MVRILGDSILDELGLPRYLLVIFATNCLLGALTYRRGVLSHTGAATAVVMGFLTFATIGAAGWLTLLLFFVTSTGLTGISRRRSQGAVPEALQKKGGCRDHIQVLANGGPACICAVLFALTEEPFLLTLFGAGIAASAADTWAGEVGILSRRPPVLITTFRQCPAGLSGGVSTLGTSAGFIGAFIMGFVWYFAFRGCVEFEWELHAFVLSIAGFIGCIVDSVLGATLQAHYWDADRNQITEHEFRNGHRYRLVRGVRWIDNDAVNLLSNVAALACVYIVLG
jgi:uncharacterized protein (TIGR00297 family)